jgi:hypothetical protein
MSTLFSDYKNNSQTAACPRIPEELQTVRFAPVTTQGRNFRLEAIDLQGKDITADALLTQRKLAHYLVEKRQAHYPFTVKANPPTLYHDIALYFQDRQAPDFVDVAPCEHGRIETRRLGTPPSH